MDEKSNNVPDDSFDDDLSNHPGTRLVETHEWDPIVERFQLSEREAEVIIMLFGGHTRDSVARRLEIKPRTVRQYIEQIHAKLGVDDRIKMVLTVVEARDQLRSSQ